MSSVGVIAFLLKKGKSEDARRTIVNYEPVVSTNVTTGAAKIVLRGTILHVSKSKKVTYTKTVSSDKKSKREVNYFRLVFCRECGSSGNVFAMLFDNNPTDKQNFALSELVVGEGVNVIKPQLEGMWCNMPILWSPDPCLHHDVNWNPFVPAPFPDSGFVSFCILDIRLSVISVEFISTCSGRLCRGLYGDNSCCCPYICTKFTEDLVGCQLLENAVQSNSDDVLDILRHVQDELESGLWDVLGWWKASKTTDATPDIAKCHIVSLRKKGAMKRFQRTEE